MYVEKLFRCKLFIVSDLCKNKCIEIVVLDLKFVRIVESCLTGMAFDCIADGSCKKRIGKLFLFLGSNVFCKPANLYFALVRLIKPVIVSRGTCLFCSIYFRV